jgi:hypothetical protein
MQTFEAHFKNIWENDPTYTEPNELSIWKLHKALNEEGIENFNKDLSN